MYRANLQYLRERFAPSELEQRDLAVFEQRGGNINPPGVRELITLILRYAPALRSALLRDIHLPTWLLARPLLEEVSVDALESSKEFQTLISASAADPAAMRRFRHRHMTRVTVREILQLADIETTSRELACVAAVLTHCALLQSRRQLISMHGDAYTEDRSPVPLVCLGMGKLGGYELNPGSDIDLCFFYETDAAKVEGGALAVHEFFTQVVRNTVHLLSENTEDGRCFRVDLRLRPEGNSGPIVNSFYSAEQYYETFGQTWERAAMLRATPVAGDRAAGAALLAQLAPFIYRKSIDTTIPQQLAFLLQRGRDLANNEQNIKLGRGGIREVEFFVQSLQLIWGGHHKAIRCPNTMEALRRMERLALVSHREMDTLSSGWRKLRRIEHAIHAQSEYQTHALPQTADGIEHLAELLGYRTAVQFVAETQRIRAEVHTLFVSLTGKGNDDALTPFTALSDAILAEDCDTQSLLGSLQATLHVQDPHEAVGHLQRLARRMASPFHPKGRAEWPDLAPRFLREISLSADPTLALRFLTDFFSKLGGPWPYARIFEKHPEFIRKTIKLFGTSATLSQALIGHPEHLDSVLFTDIPKTPTSIAEIHQRLIRDEALDREAYVSALRSAKVETLLVIGLAWLNQQIHLETCLSLISTIAETQLEYALKYSVSQVFARPWCREIANWIAIFAGGKLGGSELGFGGDLDIFFVYDESQAPSFLDQDNILESASRIAQRCLDVLAQPNYQGAGYAVDTRLRPSGRQGLLVVSTAAFQEYYQREASPWERQTLVRMRALAPSHEAFQHLLNDTRRTSLGERPILLQDIASMRRRVETEGAYEARGRLNPKLGRGALMDIDFLTQHWSIQYKKPSSRTAPQTLAVLTELAAEGQITNEKANTLIQAYHFYRKLELMGSLIDHTHELVISARDIFTHRIARALGFGQGETSAALEMVREYTHHTQRVRAVFDDEFEGRHSHISA